MLAIDIPRATSLVISAAVLLGLLAAGCGDAGVGKTYAVSGKVTLDGQPLVAKSAIVSFKPIAAKGNTTPFEPAANVDSSGNYILYTNTQRGAPPGWYKVIVTAIEPALPAANPNKPLTQRPAPKSLVPAKYGQERTTPLEIEVVESPSEGTYDLKLTH